MKRCHVFVITMRIRVVCIHFTKRKIGNTVLVYSCSRCFLLLVCLIPICNVYFHTKMVRYWIATKYISIHINNEKNLLSFPFQMDLMPCCIAVVCVAIVPFSVVSAWFHFKCPFSLDQKQKNFSNNSITIWEVFFLSLLCFVLFLGTWNFFVCIQIREHPIYHCMYTNYFVAMFTLSS